MPLRESPQAVKQHAVPQNIMQVEFKIIGELTMRQFMYLLTFSGFAFASFQSELPSLIRLPLTGVLAFAGIAFAFLPVEERGLDQWVISFLSAIFSPTQRVWRKEVKTPYYFAYHAANMIKSEMLTVAPTSSRRKLEKYLETEGALKKRDPLDVFDKEDDYIRKVREVLNNPSTTSAVPTTPISSYFSYATTTVAPTVKVRTEDEIINNTNVIPASQNVIPSPDRSPGQAPEGIQLEKPPTDYKVDSRWSLPRTAMRGGNDSKGDWNDKKNHVNDKTNKGVSLAIPEVAVKSLEITDAKTVIKESKDLLEKTVEDKPKIVIPESRPSGISGIQADETGSRVPAETGRGKHEITNNTAKNDREQSNALSTVIPAQAGIQLAESGTDYKLDSRLHGNDKKSLAEVTPVNAPMMEAVTPDRLTGRRFTHLTKTEGEIVLPIRGERVLKTAEEDLDEDINKKADELLALVEKVRKEHEKLRTVKEGENLSKEEEETKVPLSDVAKKAVEDAAIKNAELAKQIEALKAMSGTTTKNPQEKEVIDTKVKALQEEKFNAEEQIKTLKQQITDLEERLAKGGDQPKVIVQKVIEKVHVPVFDNEFDEKKPAVPPQKPTIAKTPAFTNIPNVINGIVKDEKGILLEGAVIVIKDSRGDTVRALKTNKLGQFLITTPVSSGAYTVEITKPGIRTAFVPISIEVKGEVLPPVEITGKL